MKKLFIFPFLLLLFSQCGEDEYVPPKELPPITTTGENTFACKINGENWSYDRNDLGGGKGFWIDFTTPESVSIAARNSESRQLINLFFNSFLAENEENRLHWPPPPQPFGLARYRSNKDCPEYNVSSEEYAMEGKLTILRFDWNREERIIAGTFEFTFINLTCGDTTHITEGRFDLSQ